MESDIDANLVSCRKQRNSGITVVILNVVALLTGFLIYGRFSNIVVTSESSKLLLDLSTALYILLLMTLIAIAFGIYRVYKSERSRIRLTNDSKATTFKMTATLTYFAVSSPLLVTKPLTSVCACTASSSI